MAYPIDPMKARYWPEIFGEAGYITTEESGAEIAAYTNYHDYIVQLVTLATSPETTDHSAIRVNSDAGSNLVNSTVDARFYADKHEDLKVTGIESLSLYGYYPSGGGGGQIVQYRYGLRVTKPTIYEKILLDMSLTDAEEALNTKFAIKKKILAGVLSGQTQQNFTKIYEVAKRLSSGANVNPTVGSEIHPLSGNKVVLLSIAVDEAPAADQVYVNVTRDGEQVMRMDAYGFQEDILDNTGGASDYVAQSNYEIPLYIVATDILRVWVENTVDLSGTPLNVRFKYGIAPLTIIEKIRWGLVLTDEEQSIAAEFDLSDSVIAGVT